MRSRTLTSQYQRLQALIRQADEFAPDQLELQSHFARYLCVLSAGFLENSLSDVYGRYAETRSHGSIANYVESRLKKIQNPKSGKFVETAIAFDRTWEDALRAFLEEDGRKDAIDAIMANRHLIAHGKDSGISLARVTEYLQKSIQVVDFIEGQCGLR